MEHTIVYKVTRSDRLSYIGITNDLHKRLGQHRRTKRFSSHPILFVEILAEYQTREEALLNEACFIAEHQTFEKGLNETISGAGCGHGSPLFTTLGYKYSAKSRQKMREAWVERKKRGDVRRGFTHSEETKRKMSLRKRGRSKPIKFTEEAVKQILLVYKEYPNISGVGRCPRSGHVVTYERAFSKQFAKRFNMTPVYLYNIITGRAQIWKLLREEILDTKS